MIPNSQRQSPSNGAIELQSSKRSSSQNTPPIKNAHLISHYPNGAHKARSHAQLHHQDFTLTQPYYPYVYYLYNHPFNGGGGPKLNGAAASSPRNATSPANKMMLHRPISQFMAGSPHQRSSTNVITNSR